jgi:predicted HAD superfamily Cof-like phosphohydrolase
MKKQLDYIREFDNKFHDYLQSQPNREIPDDVKKLRQMLMQEELKEVLKAMDNEPIENIAKEFADLFLVLLGTVGAYGLLDKFEAIIEEVHKSNMTKTHVPGEGKPKKLEGYVVADIDRVLF